MHTPKARRLAHVTALGAALTVATVGRADHGAPSMEQILAIDL